TALAPCLPPELLSPALEAAQNMRYEPRRAEALAALAPRLPAELLDQALQAALNMHDDDSRIQALSSLVLYVNRELQNQLINEMISLTEGSLGLQRNSIKHILFSLNNGSALSPGFKRDCIKRIIRQVAKLPRKEILKGIPEKLMPDMYKLICSTLPETEHK